MYEAFYGFIEKPFNLTPDPKYLYLSARHNEAFAHLEFGRRERGGFILITGEVGTGKTTLARYFLSRLDAGTATAVVLYPALTAAELLRSILDDLHVATAPEASLKELVDALHRFLLDARAQERDVVLLIDEAQDLSPEVLEQVRLISNLETDTEKLIQIVLMGQSELKDMLSRHELRQLAQRITARYHLSPLNRQETEQYVRHRLAVAGGEGKVALSRGAIAATHDLSHGIPRIINLLCDRALLAGYVEGSRQIDASMILRASREVLGHSRTRSRKALYAAAAVLLFGVLGAIALRALPRVVSAPPVASASAPPAAPASAPVLEPLLLSLPRDASFRTAVHELQRLWATESLERTPLRTHMDQIRRLDLPVILEMFHPARRETCFLALVQLDGNAAIIATGAAPVRVPLAEVDRLWTRQAIFLWRDFHDLNRGGDEVRMLTWARATLSGLGYPVAEADLVSAVTQFQRDADLAPDGEIGSRTLMALYSRGNYPRPRLMDGVL